MVVAYITDLFFQAKVNETARALGVDLRIVSSLPALWSELEADGGALLLDLNAQGIQPASLIAQVKLKTPAVHVTAYCSHVQKDLMEKATRAGADQILPRSEFSRRLAEILTGLSS